MTHRRKGGFRPLGLGSDLSKSPAFSETGMENSVLQRETVFRDLPLKFPSEGLPLRHNPIQTETDTRKTDGLPGPRGSFRKTPPENSLCFVSPPPSRRVHLPHSCFHSRGPVLHDFLSSSLRWSGPGPRSDPLRVGG